MTDPVPQPSDAVLTKLAQIAGHARQLTAPDHPTDRLRVGLTKLQNDRRRAGEKILVLLADPELRNYLAQLNIKEESL
jgi:hypothetical protein